ncbi:hypothetical protein [Gracilibacillus dipsosauri]|uniref:Uncharacterized protein n=1 Tax=Gracilibacillus dipsosauri TaxID=178340 RepID=A0A317KUC0_9BACI|nr:hypothetical protein [Gracilibacillus dipsosauri]PWU67087.1 hypothetical protein DLJ74_17885 [Gracilibacillus dipsosauri]
MRRMRFAPPTDHYDERLEKIDEQICNLMKERKILSNNNPGFPRASLITEWSQKYNFYEDFLRSIFSQLLDEEVYKPTVKPRGFMKNIPILKLFEKDQILYTVTVISQFENASIVRLNIDRMPDDVMSDMDREEHLYYRLSIDAEGKYYDCRWEGGSGSGEHFSYTYIVAPALPDDHSSYQFVFTECKTPYDKATGFEFRL